MEEQAALGNQGTSPATRLRGGGMVLAVGGLLFAVATALHPSQETQVTILATEMRLVSSHAVWVVSYVLILLGLPALYVAESPRMGRLGLTGFLMAFTGTTLLAISSLYGFYAPVLAAEAPEMLDAINEYLPVVVLNGFAVVGFLAGFVSFGVAMVRTPMLPRWSGILVAVGAPLFFVGGAVALLVSPAFWSVGVLGSLVFGSGLAWSGYRMWAKPRL